MYNSPGLLNLYVSKPKFHISLINTTPSYLQCIFKLCFKGVFRLQVSCPEINEDLGLII